MKQKYRSGTYTETAGDKQNKTKEEKNMATKFPILLQIGIIVRDRDKAVAGWEKLGFKMREVGGMSGEQPPFDDLTIDGKRRAELVSKTAFFNCYGMEIELIEPVADTPYKKWLDEHGPGIHHIAVITEDSYDKVLEDYKAEKGEQADKDCRRRQNVDNKTKYCHDSPFLTRTYLQSLHQLPAVLVMQQGN